MSKLRAITGRTLIVMTVLFVPGYYDVAAVKWLERIEAVDVPFAGHFQAERYVYVGHPTHTDNLPVRACTCGH